MNRLAVLGRVAVSVAVFAVLIGVAVGVLASSRPSSPDGVVQCPSGPDSSVDGCPSQPLGGR